MYRAMALSASVVLVLAAAAFAVQQSYPNQPEMETLLDNDQVVVQRVHFPEGEWQGEHSHEGNQLAVAITDMEQLVKEDGKESVRKLKPGDILWVDKTTHDHKMVRAGTSILITLK